MGLHTATYRGLRVYVELRDGTAFLDRFVERTRSKFLIFEEHRVRVADIRSFTTSAKIIEAKLAEAARVRRVASLRRSE